MGWGVLGDIAGGAKDLAGDAADFVGDAADDVGEAFDDAMDAAGDAARSVGNAVSNASISDIGHTALDVAGMVPVIGEAADLANAGWYLAEGDKTNAALSAASAIPLAGNFATGAKWAKKGVDAVDMVADGAKAVDKASDAAKVADRAGDVARAGDDVAAGVRPSWRKSELDVGARLDGQGYQAQKSFKDGVEVPYGTKGSVRPEYYKPGSSIEVKNYNVETAQGRSNLTRNVSKQAVDRADNLPTGTRQEVFIDVRGQNASRSDLNSVVDRIVEKSNGAVQAGDINILR